MKIILATDGTEYGEAAVKMLTNFSLGDGDEVLDVSVVDMAMPLAIDVYGGYLPHTSALDNAARDNAKKIVKNAAGELREIFADNKVAISSEVLFGSPDSRIVETA